MAIKVVYVRAPSLDDLERQINTLITDYAEKDIRIEVELTGSPVEVKGEVVQPVRILDPSKRRFADDD